MSLLPPPLTRSHATTTIFTKSTQGAEVAQRVLGAYATLPFKGPRLVLPGGEVVSEDTWRDALEDDLELSASQDFNLEQWLKAKVELEGTQDQKDKLRELLRNLDEVEARERVQSFEIVSEYGGMPNDIMSVVQQPLREIPVYRSISDLPVPDAEDEPATKDDSSEAPLDSP
ncbi:hypothetical protein CTAYLR_002785 [Chrysophaeum taylorii]|uniref:Uncharacterized protein n=1 Tax=Chrysophaeum taylorii TaxID=2483200 RepID=A0AAD7UEC5_9STRA|nr:hypothetical protein CTAYLR_002785 [Chrysophaeum taylorii]